MATLNTLSCNVAGANTGIASCSFDPKNVIGAFLVPKSVIFTAAQIATLQTSLQNAVQAALGSRIYPIWGFESLTDNSEKLVVQTMGYGNKRVVREGKYDLTYSRKKGGHPLQRKLRVFNFNEWGVLFVDASYFIFGTKDLNGNLAGASLDYFYAHPFTFSDGQKITEYLVEFAMSDPKQINDNVGYVQCNFDPTQISGLLDVLLNQKTVTPAPAAGTFEIGAVLDDNGTDLYPTYNSAMAVGNLWQVTNPATGASIAIISVAQDATNDCWKLVLIGPTIAAPSGVTATPSSTGGTIPAGTSYYKVTALNANGETVGSSEASATTTGSTSSVALAWSAVTGATSYKIYKGSTAGGESSYFTASGTSFTDTGAAGTAGTVPTSNSTGAKDPNYPAVGQNLTIAWAAPTALAAAQVVGCEAVPLTVAAT